MYHPGIPPVSNRLPPFIKSLVYGIVLLDLLQVRGSLARGRMRVVTVDIGAGVSPACTIAESANVHRQAGVRLNDLIVLWNLVEWLSTIDT